MGGAWLAENERTNTVYQQKVAATVFTQFGVTTFDPLFTAIRALLPASAYIGGGYPMDLLGHHQTGDIDIWFHTSDARTATKAAIQALLQQAPWSSYGLHEASRGDFTEFKIARQGQPLVQVSLNGYFLFDDAKHVIDLFDFTVAQVILDGTAMWVGPTTLADIEAKRLVFHQHQSTLIHRVPKYIRKGYIPTTEAMDEIATLRKELIHKIHIDANTQLLAERPMADTPINRNSLAALPPALETRPDQLLNRPPVVPPPLRVP